MADKYVINRDIPTRELNAIRRLGLGSFGDKRDYEGGLTDAEKKAKRGTQRAYYLPPEFLNADVSYYGIEEEKAAVVTDFPGHDREAVREIFVKMTDFRDATREEKETKEAELKEVIAKYNKEVQERAKIIERNGKEATIYQLSFDKDSAELTAKGVSETVKGKSVVRKPDESFVKRDFVRKSRTRVDELPRGIVVDRDNPGAVYTSGVKKYIVERVKNAEGEFEDVYYKLEDYPQLSENHERSYEEYWSKQSIARDEVTQLYSHEIVLSGSEIDNHDNLSGFVAQMKKLQTRYGRKIFSNVDLGWDDSVEVAEGKKRHKKVTLVFDSSRTEFNEASQELYSFMQMSSRAYSEEGRTGPRLEREYRDAYKRMDGLPFAGPLALVPGTVAAVADTLSWLTTYLPVVSPTLSRVAEAGYEAAARGLELTPGYKIGFSNFCKSRQVDCRARGASHFAFEEEHDGTFWGKDGSYELGKGFFGNGSLARFPRNLVAATTGAVSTVASIGTAIPAVITNFFGDALAFGSVALANKGKDLGRKSDWFSKYLLSPIARLGSGCCAVTSVPFKVVGAPLTAINKACSVGEYLADPQIPSEKRTWGSPAGNILRAISKNVDGFRFHAVKSPQLSQGFVAFDVVGRSVDSLESDEVTKKARECALVLKPFKTKKSRISGDNIDYVKLGVVEWEEKKIKMMLSPEGDVLYSDESFGAGYSNSADFQRKLTNVRGFQEKVIEVLEGKIATSTADKSSGYSLKEFRETFLTPEAGAEGETIKQVAIREIRKALDEKNGKGMVKQIPGTNRYIVGNNWFSGNYVVEVTDHGIGIAKQRNEVDTDGALPLVDLSLGKDGSISINQDLFNAMNWLARKTENHTRNNAVSNWHYYTTGKMPTSEESREESRKGDEREEGSHEVDTPSPPSIPLRITAPSSPSSPSTSPAPKGATRGILRTMLHIR